MLRPLLALSMSLHFACLAAPEGEPLGPATSEVDLDGKADATEARLRVADMTIWIDSDARFETRAGQRALVFEGRTSRNLDAVHSWVPDDAFGTPAILSARRFEVALVGDHEINTLLSGLPLGIDLEPTSGAYDVYHARVVFQPRFVAFSGDSALWVSSRIRPVRVFEPSDPLRYRGHVYPNAELDGLTVVAESGASAQDTVRVSDGLWAFDFRYDELGQPLAAGEELVLTAQTGGTTLSKRGRLGVGLSSLSATVDDPDLAWPAPTCDAGVQACLDGFAADPSECGDYREVSRCEIRGGVCQDEVELDFTPVDTSSFAASIDAFNDDCGNTGSWCSISAIEAYAIPACSDDSLETVVDRVLALGQQQSDYFQWGTIIDRSALASAEPFGGVDDAEPLLLALDTLAPLGELPVVWTGIFPVPCHNCTDNETFAVLVYPDSDRVVVIRGGWGFDS